MRVVLSAFLLLTSVSLLGIVATTKPLLSQEACPTVDSYQEGAKAYPDLTVEVRDARFLGRFLLVSGVEMPAGSKATTVMLITGPNAVVLGLIEPDGCVSQTLVIPRAHYELMRNKLERDA